MSASAVRLPLDQLHQLPAPLPLPEQLQVVRVPEQPLVVQVLSHPTAQRFSPPQCPVPSLLTPTLRRS